MKNEISIKSFDLGGVRSRQQVWKVIGLTLLVCGSLYGQQIIAPIDVPDNTSLGTWPTAINQTGVIVGYYLDANNVYHGFVGTPNHFTTIDFPGATGTYAISINEGGTIVGYYTGIGIYGFPTLHNFLRTPNGTITNIDPPTGPPTYFSGSSFDLDAPNRYPIVINAAGVVAGNYGSNTGWLRTPDGSLSPLPFVPTGINGDGAIAGWTGFYVGQPFVPQNGYFDQPPTIPIPGFLRAPNGTITPFVPTSPLSVYGAATWGVTTFGINSTGVITGNLTDFYGVHGFVAAPNGTITAFDSPDSENYYWLQYGLPPGFGGVTRPYAINPAGTVTGDYSASYPQPKTAYLGFVWVSPPTGKFTSFDPHPADSIETHPLAINPAGDITGYYLVYVPSPLPHTVAHGFLRSH